MGDNAERSLAAGFTGGPLVVPNEPTVGRGSLLVSGHPIAPALVSMRAVRKQVAEAAGHCAGRPQE
jgi:hypothetical protein